MNSRVKIVKRSVLEVRQHSEGNHNNATVSNERETAVIVKGWIADRNEKRRVEETWRWETLIKLGR